MPSIDDYLSEAFRSLGPKPDEETANQAEKKRFFRAAIRESGIRLRPGAS